MKKSTIFLFFIILLVIPFYLYDADALRQVAGKIELDIKPGQTTSFDWGLASDSNSNPTQIVLSSEKDGSEFLSFEKNITLDPLELKYAKVTVSIPDSYPGGITLEPFLYATEFGEKGGATVINIRMLKVVTLNIAPNDDPNLRVDWNSLEKESDLESHISDSQLNEKEKSPSTMTIIQSNTPDPEPVVDNPQGGGCLIATAVYGSEMAPQVQFLREIRDDKLMSTATGASFMAGFNQLYYTFSPTIADLERENPLFKEAVKLAITPMLSTLSIMTLAEDGSDVQVLGLGISVIILNLGMYIAAPTITAWQIKKRI